MHAGPLDQPDDKADIEQRQHADGQLHVAPLLVAARQHEAQRLHELGAADMVDRMREALLALVAHFDEGQGTPPRR